MISYEVYKILHLVFLLMFAASLGICFATDIPLKAARIVSMISSGLMFVAGFGLLARLGIKEWPLWVKAKMAIWLVLAIAGPILARKATKHRIWIFRGLMLLFFTAITLAVLKPV